MSRGVDDEYRYAEPPSPFQLLANGKLTPPHNIEAEGALLGALMVDNQLADEVRGNLTADDFFDPFHGDVFKRIMRITAKGKLANPVTLRPYYEGMGQVLIQGSNQRFDTAVYLAQLTGSGAVLIGARDFANQVRELSTLRKLLQHHIDGIGRVLDPNENEDVAALMQSTEASLFEVSDVGLESATGSSFANAWDEVMDEHDKVAAGGGHDGVVLKGYDDMNEIVCPMERGDLILVGGRPGMGKTGVGAKIARSAAAAGFASEFLSLEMDKRRAARRIVADVMYRQGITSSFDALCNGKLRREDFREIAEARQEIDDLPLRVDAPKVMYVENLIGWIRKRQRAWASRGKELRLVVIDYLGRFATKRFMTATERATFISNEVKRAGQETGVTIVLLCQLSREVERRDDKRPVLSDLRDSGSLEQDADGVVFVYRDEYYLERSEPPKANMQKWDDWRTELSAVKDRYEIYTAKRRDGALMRRRGYYFAAFQAIRDSNYYRTGEAYGQGAMDI